MEFFLIAAVSLGAAMLTFFSGFGLGTILMPVFALFFPLEVAIALTAVVHLLNNMFKVTLIWRSIDYKTAAIFGIPAATAAFFGAWLLNRLTVVPVSFQYQLAEKQLESSLLNVVIAILLILFSLFELNKKLASFSFKKSVLPVGGLLSGFFGGISGHQGALRSLFLLKAGLTKEGFIATGILIAICIDISRITVYGSSFLFQKLDTLGNNMSTFFVLLACISAFIGTTIGRLLLKKVTFRKVQVIVSLMLFVFAVLLGMGVV